MLRKLWILTLTLCTLFLLLGLLPVHGEAEIYDSVLRLHVLANSDSEEDQALKLKVRDALLETGEGLFDGCESRDEAAQTVEAHRERLTQIARETVRAEGYDYDVSLVLGMEEYPTRSYGSLCFPSGEYLSLRVVIGKGEGENWWCVLFPPLCMSAASAKVPDEDAYISVGLTGDQYHVITESEQSTYTVRFKILESIREAVEAWK